MNAQGIFFQDKVLSPESLGALGNAALGDGVLTGCSMSYTNGVLSITEAGYIIACGRVIYVPVGTISASATGYVKAVVNTENTDVPATVVYSASAPGSQGDINLNATTYECVIATINNGVVSLLTAGRGGSGGGSGLTRLWYNQSSPPTMAADGVVTGIDFAAWSLFYVVFQRYPKSSSEYGKSLYGQLFYVPQDSTEYNLMKTSANDSGSYSGGVYYRTDVLIPGDGTSQYGYDYFYSRGLTFFRDQNAIMFHQGRYSRRSNSSYYEDDGAMVPILIYGVG